MSALATDTLPTTVAGELTATLIPTVTRINARQDVSPTLVFLASFLVCILSLVTIAGNSIILVAFYKYKRLRTASNCLLVSLAISDFGVGVFMPFGMQLELSGLPENGVSALCIVPYCVVIALCSVSVLVTVAIAVDRLTSLAQPLRYKNIITHSSIEKYIAVFWIYAIGVGLSPLIYAQIFGEMQSNSANCRFDAAVLPPVRVFLVVAVWAPSALVLLGCYMYVYLVARAHARAIYTVELSFRHQTQTMALPRYGQTLAVTVGAFLILWLPFQTCMLVDIFYGTSILSEWAVVWLGLPILAHSGANPWIYAFHHVEMRLAVGKITGTLTALLCAMPGRYGCSPMRRGTNTNLELAEVNNSNESRQQPVEDCFAAKQHGVLYSSRRCLEVSGRHTDISPERNDDERATAASSNCHGIEEDIHDLTKMLDPKYILDRNHVIDSNHNIDKIKNLKYLLDPTFNKIRHLRRLNHKRMSGKGFPFISDPKFISYQNLKSDGAHVGGSRRFLQLNALSDPMLHADSPVVNMKDLNDMAALCHNRASCNRRNSNLASVSDSNIKAATARATEATGGLKLAYPPSGRVADDHGYSVQNLNHGKYEGALARHAMMLHRQMEEQQQQNAKASPQPRRKLRGYFGHPSPNLHLKLQNGGHATTPLSAPGSAKPSTPATTPRRCASPSQQHRQHVTITPNKLANLISLDPPPGARSAHTRVDLAARTSLAQTRRNLEILRHSESINTIDPATRVTLLEPSNLMDSLVVPTIHSEPPSPIDPLPSSTVLGDDEACILGISRRTPDAEVARQRAKSPLGKRSSPVRHSDPVIPTVLLNIEDYSEPSESDGRDTGNDLPFASGDTPTMALEPIDLFEALLRNSDRGRDAGRLPEPIFAEHDSTRFSSRRPSDSKWSESSRSQEILPSVTEHQTFPSSYSVNDFQTCRNSGSDLNDLTSLDPFMCPDALTSSLRESFFSAPSVPDSDIFTSFEESDEPGFTPDLTPDFTPETERHVASAVAAAAAAAAAATCNSFTPTVNPKRCAIEANLQSRSTESVHHARQPSTRSCCAILKLEPSVHSSRLRVRPGANCILRNPSVRGKPRLAPLAIPTPTDISTPTFDVVTEIKSDNVGVGVRV